MAAGDVETNITSNNSRGCAIFDGVDDSILIPAFANKNINNAMTWSFWAMVDYNDPAGFDVFYMDSNEDVANGFMFLSQDFGASPDLIMYYSTGAASTAAAKGDYFLNQYNKWIYMTIVVDFTAAKVYWYRDGSYLSDSNLTTPVYPGKDYTKVIGANSDQGSRYIQGKISDFRVYNKALSASEIEQLYNGDDITDGLTNRWKLQDDFTDSVGGYDGTNSGSVLGIAEDAVAEAISDDRVTANDTFLMASGAGGQIVSAVIEEAP